MTLTDPSTPGTVPELSGVDAHAHFDATEAITQLLVPDAVFGVRIPDAQALLAVPGIDPGLLDPDRGPCDDRPWLIPSIEAIPFGVGPSPKLSFAPVHPISSLSARLPTTLRIVPIHGVQLKRRYDRRRMPKIRITLFAALFATVYIAFTKMASYRQTPLNYFLSIVWSAYAPLIVIGLVGAYYRRAQQSPRRRRRAARTPAADTEERSPVGRYKSFRSDYAGRTDQLLVVTVPTLLAPGNLPALQRVLLSLLVNLPNHFNRFQVDIVTEGDVSHEALTTWLDTMGALARPIRIVNVPADYATANGAEFKTRANQFAMEARRAARENTTTSWVYHLDDDTHIGTDTAAALAEFIEVDGSHFLLAQGVLAFPHELTPSKFCRLADAIRPADDLTRFAFFTGALGTPLGGLHGEHLVIRADIEEEIGWDFPNTVIEDAYFAIEFATRYPRRSTMLNAYSYGASPATITDLVRQRRRWIEGLLRLAFNRKLPLAPKIPLLYSIFTWSLAPFQFVGLALLISYVFGIDNTSPISPWFLPLWSLGLAGIFWFYIEGLKVNLSASDRPRSHILLAVVAVPAVYVVTLVETVGVVLGIVRFMGFGRQKVSEVITKPI